MPPNRTARLRVFRTALLLSIVLSLLCVVVPSEALSRTGLLAILGNLGTARVEAADVTVITVDNSTSDMAVMAPTQRKLFYAAGRFWIFYTDGAELVYKSSSDGLSWSDRSASLGVVGSGVGLSVHYDGTYLHYARTTGINTEPLYYRRGVAGADGTIVWSAAEQTAVAGVSAARYLYPSVSVDSSGHALISYHSEKQNGHAGEGPYVAKSGNNDGTWGTTPAGFPHEVTAASESEWYTTVHGLAADKIAVTFADHTNVAGVSIATYDGLNWNSPQTTVSNPQFGSGYSAVAEGDDLHIALLTTSTFDLLYCKYTYATNTIGPEHTLMSPATSSSFPALSKDSNNDLYCFWPGAPTPGHIYYSRMISGVWDALSTDWLTETDLMATGGLSAFYDQGASDYLGVAWETGTASPYRVRFAAVAPNQPPDQPANVSPADGAVSQSLTPALQSSAFSDADSGDTHAASQWQVTAAAGDYSNPAFDSQTGNVSLVGILVPSGRLSYSTTYYWHVRHQDGHGEWSSWSVETSFSTISAPNQLPDQPGNVAPADGAVNQSLMPTLQSSAFSDADSGDTHAASHWQITAVVGDYSNPVFDSQTDDANLVSILVPSGRLSYSTTYCWHVRHQDDHGGWSGWSVETRFVTSAAPSTPPDEPGNVDTGPSSPDTPPQEPEGGNTAPALPDAGNGQGILPFILAIAAGVASVAIVSSVLLLGYSAHVRSVNRQKDLRSARTISDRLRK